MTKLEPYWPDGCGHKENEFLGTVMESGAPVDVYVFKANLQWGSCARYGAEGREYRSGEYKAPPIEFWKPANYLMAARIAEIEGAPIVSTCAEVDKRVGDFPRIQWCLKNNIERLQAELEALLAVGCDTAFDGRGKI